MTYKVRHHWPRLLLLDLDFPWPMQCKFTNNNVNCVFSKCLSGAFFELDVADIVWHFSWTKRSWRMKRNFASNASKFSTNRPAQACWAWMQTLGKVWPAAIGACGLHQWLVSLDSSSALTGSLDLLQTLPTKPWQTGLDQARSCALRESTLWGWWQLTALTELFFHLCFMCMWHRLGTFSFPSKLKVLVKVVRRQELLNSWTPRSGPKNQIITCRFSCAAGFSKAIIPLMVRSQSCLLVLVTLCFKRCMASGLALGMFLLFFWSLLLLCLFLLLLGFSFTFAGQDWRCSWPSFVSCTHWHPFEHLATDKVDPVNVVTCQLKTFQIAKGQLVATCLICVHCSCELELYLLARAVRGWALLLHN